MRNIRIYPVPPPQAVGHSPDMGRVKFKIVWLKSRSCSKLIKQIKTCITDFNILNDVNVKITFLALDLYCLYDRHVVVGVSIDATC